MMPAVYNTKKSGYIHYMIYKDKKEYVGVVLDFGLVEYEQDPEKLEKSILEAALSYLETVRKKNLPDEYLNLPVEKKYRDILKDMEMVDELKKKASSKKHPASKEDLAFSTITHKPYFGQSL